MHYVPHVTHLSKCFQISDCNYSIIPGMLASTITSLQQLIAFDGPNLGELRKTLDDLTAADIQLNERGNQGKEYFENSIRRPYIECLVKNLEDRFDDKSVIAAFDIFNPVRVTCLPSENDISLFLQYGNSEVKDLAKQYTRVVPDTNECVDEWAIAIDSTSKTIVDI